MDFKCPECGEPLTYRLLKGEKDTINIGFFCESAKDDVFSFEIETGLSDYDIRKMEKGEILRREMSLKVLHKLPKTL